MYTCVNMYIQLSKRPKHLSQTRFFLQEKAYLYDNLNIFYNVSSLSVLKVVLACKENFKREGKCLFNFFMHRFFLPFFLFVLKKIDREYLRSVKICIAVVLNVVETSCI